MSAICLYCYINVISVWELNFFDLSNNYCYFCLGPQLCTIHAHEHRLVPNSVALEPPYCQCVSLFSD